MNEAWESLAFQTVELDTPTAVLGTNGQILEGNAAWRRFGADNGYDDPKCGQGLNYIEVCESARGRDSMGARQVADGLRQVLAGDTHAFVHEYPCHSPTDQRWFQLVALPRDLIGGGGAVVSHVNVTRPVMKRMAQERSHTLIQQISQQVAICVLEIDQQGRLVEVNSSGLRLLSLDSADRILGSSYLDHVSDQDRDKVQRAIDEAFDGRVRRFSYRTSGNGNSHYLEVKLVPLKDLHGRIYRVLGLAEDVTEREVAIADLAHFKNRHRAISELASDYLFSVSREAGVNWTFDWAAGNVSGFDGLLPRPGDQMPEALSSLIYPHDVSSFRSIWDRLTADDQVHATLRLVSPTRGVRWFDLRARSEKEHSEGEVDRITGRLSDISTQKETEERLLEEKRRVVDYLNVAGALIMALDEMGHITLINRRGCEILGYGEDEIVGRDWINRFLPIEARATMRKAHREILAGHPNGWAFFETEIVTWSGERRMIAWYNAPLNDREGRIVGILSSGVDVTERKKAEDESRVLRDRYQDISRLTTDFVYSFKKSDDSVFRLHWRAGHLPSLEEYLPVAGQPIEVMDQIVHPDDRDRVAKAQTRLLNGGATDLIFRFLLPSGSIRWVRWLAKPKLDDLKVGVAEIVGGLKDITAQILAEEGQAALKGQLRQTERLAALGTLAGGIAHDFNNILTPILGYGRIALSEVPVDSVTHNDLQRVVVAARRARDLVQQILIFSRRSKVEKGPMHIQPVVDEAIQIIQQSLQPRIKLTSVLEAECPPIEGNSTQLYQVVYNLITNACQACNGQGGDVDVSLAGVEVDAELAERNDALEPGSYVRLRVRDTGKGIDPDIMKQIFDPFFSTKPAGRGSGMGLAVVHGIICEHEGAVLVESVPGEGAVFDVYLPAHAGEVIDASEYAEQKRGSGERILLVDDDREVGHAMTRMLERLGYEVSCFDDAKAALEDFKSGETAYDIALLDQAMPEVDGVSLGQMLKNIEEGFPVIIVSGYSEDLSVKSIKSLGLDDYILKPVLDDELAESIYGLLHE